MPTDLPTTSALAPDSTTDPAGLGRQVSLCAGIAFVAVFACLFTALVVTGSASGPSLGIAFFAAFWGGGGFGAMIGGVLYALRVESAAPAPAASEATAPASVGS